jgi:hypothetical protein
MVASLQVIITRSEALTPAPRRTITDSGAGADAHDPGELLVPIRNTKSAAVKSPGRLAMSMAIPLIPLV